MAKIERDDTQLVDLRFHDLRHEATSRLFEKGLGIMEVASMTGHKSLAMLKRHAYSRANPPLVLIQNRHRRRAS